MCQLGLVAIIMYTISFKIVSMGWSTVRGWAFNHIPFYLMIFLTSMFEEAQTFQRKQAYPYADDTFFLVKAVVVTHEISKVVVMKLVNSSEAMARN